MLEGNGQGRERDRVNADSPLSTGCLSTRYTSSLLNFKIQQIQVQISHFEGLRIVQTEAPIRFHMHVPITRPKACEGSKESTEDTEPGPV